MSESENERDQGRWKEKKKKLNGGDMHIAASFENNEHTRRNSALFMPVVLKFSPKRAIYQFKRQENRFLFCFSFFSRRVSL